MVKLTALANDIASTIQFTKQANDASLLAANAAQAASASIIYANYKNIEKFLSSIVQPGETINNVNYEGDAFLTKTHTQRVTDTNNIHICYVIDVSASDINKLFNTSSQSPVTTINLYENIEKTSTAIEIECEIDDPTDDSKVFNLMADVLNFLYSLFYYGFTPNKKHNFYVQCPSGSNIYGCLPFFAIDKFTTFSNSGILNSLIANYYVNGEYNPNTPTNLTTIA
jgi:hypothetical protein